MEKQNIHKINGEIRISPQVKRMMDFFIQINAIILDFKENEKEYEVHKHHNDILERDIQITRFKEEVESLKKQIIQGQAELQGEAVERDWYAKLTKSLLDDIQAWYYCHEHQNKTGDEKNAI